MASKPLIGKPLTDRSPVEQQLHEMDEMEEPLPDRSLLERQMREMEERLVELREQIDELQLTFEVEEKPR